jgi:DNA-binding MarR family transcriptional regulator
LERRGLIRRARHEMDKRARSLALSDHGHAFHDAIIKQDLINMEAMLSILAPEERAPFVTMMTRIAARLTSEE